MFDFPIKDVELLRLQPGDLLIATLDADVDQGQILMFQRVLKERFAALGIVNVEGLVIAGSSVQLKVVRAAEWAAEGEPAKVAGEG